MDWQIPVFACAVIGLLAWLIADVIENGPGEPEPAKSEMWERGK